MSMHAAGLPVSPEVVCLSPRQAVMLYACELADLAWNFQCVRELDLLAKRAVGGDGDGVGRVGKAVGRRRWRGERWRWKGDGMEV